MVVSHAIVSSSFVSNRLCFANSVGQANDTTVAKVIQATYLGHSDNVPRGCKILHRVASMRTGESVRNKRRIPMCSSSLMKVRTLMKSAAVVSARLIVRAPTICGRSAFVWTSAYMTLIAGRA